MGQDEFRHVNEEELAGSGAEIQARLDIVNAELVGRLEQLSADGYEILETGIPFETSESLETTGVPERLKDMTRIMNLVSVKDALYLSDDQGTGKLTAVLGAYTIFKRPLTP